MVDVLTGYGNINTKNGVDNTQNFTFSEYSTVVLNRC